LVRLLQAAMKMSRFGTCLSAPEQLTAHAAASKHAELLLAVLPQVLQQRAAAYSSTQQKPDMALDSPYRQLTMCMLHLSQLPAAAEISSSTAFRLLLEALQLRGSGPSASTPGVVHLPAALSISSQQLVQLLAITLKEHQYDNHKILWQFPALKQFTQSEIAQLLLVAAEAANVAGIQRFGASWSRWTTDGRQLGSAAVLPALEAAVKCDTQCSTELLKLPAAKQVSSNELTQLLQTAVLCGTTERLHRLCKLPAAQQLSRAAVEELLLAAVQHSKATAALLLCTLPAACQLASGNKLAQLLQLGEQLGPDDWMNRLRNLIAQ
jgi:hypothetical protein